MIVVVGSGIAGLMAALAAAGDTRAGRGPMVPPDASGARARLAADPDGIAPRDVLLVSKTGLTESNTFHAQGGVAAAIFPDDDPDLHARDTMDAGAGLNDPAAVRILTREGAARCRELIAAGWRVDRDAEGRPLRGLEAAHSRARVIHAGGDATGRVLELDVAALVRSNPRIHVLEHAFLEDLLVRDGRVAGIRVLVRDAGDSPEGDGAAAGTVRDIAADRVVLATGGAGRLFPYTTNPQVATGDGLAAALRAGAQVADLEFYQFHPTAMATGEHFLVSEAVRGEGAVLLDRHGRRFMPAIDPRAELAPRDVVARANFRVMADQDGQPVRLDVSPMAADHPDLAAFLAHRFPTIDAMVRSLGYDWSREPIPVAPAAHYWMGGIRTDLVGRTSLPGLYAAGECARTGVQGANRLASNSLLEGMVYGRRAGLAAAGDPDGMAWQPEPFVDAAIRGLPVAQTPMRLDVPDRAAPLTREELQREMWEHVGLIRDGDGLSRAVDRIGAALAAVAREADADGAARPRTYDEAVRRLETRNLVEVGYVTAVAARIRCESRGAHTRSDFPERNPDIDHSLAYTLAWPRAGRRRTDGRRPSCC